MLRSIEQAKQISAEVEPAIMRSVAARKKYSTQIKLYRSRAKIAFLISTISLILFGISSTLELVAGADDPMQVTSFIGLAGIGITFIFFVQQIGSSGEQQAL